MKTWGDQKIPNRPPDEFYNFMNYGLNTRSALVRTNKDLFLIWGQNGFIAGLIALLYLIVTFFRLGQHKMTIIGLVVKISRYLLKMFFVKMQMLALVELGNHKVSVR